MPYLETVQELLEAKEGEHVQFKESKIWRGGEVLLCFGEQWRR
jgi:hypothetical protein